MKHSDVCLASRLLVFLVGAVLNWGAAAESADGDLPALPATALVRQALRNAPEVLASRAVIGAEQAHGQRLAQGSNEWLVRVSGQQRRIAAPAQSVNEWDVSIEHALRLPGKARIDAELGAQGVKQAETAYGDALHEASRGLLASWFAWLKEKSLREQWDAQVEALALQARASQRRQQLGDAPKMDVLLADAALAQAKAARQQASAKEIAAETALRQRYPNLPLPLRISLPEPRWPAGSAESWLEKVASHSHELALARGETRKAQLDAARADAERSADPTLGLRHASERGGEERVTGLVFSMALPGVGRDAVARQSTALAQAAAHREAATLTKLRSETLALAHGASAAYQAWRASKDAAGDMERAAQLTLRAQQLGEASVAEVLAIRRLANDAALAERIARLEALESRYRLELDGHEIWDMDD